LTIAPLRNPEMSIEFDDQVSILGNRMKTYSAKPNEIVRDWYVVDLDGKTVGRVATEIARVLRGKHKAIYTPHVDTGDFVVAINAEKVAFTGKKLNEKKYYRHSGYPGGLTEVTAEQQLGRFPERVIEAAVKGMLPKGPLGRQMFKKFKAYSGSEHPHAAQQPKTLEV
jgi:large subunit ribosomal protein L13